jgi:Flp pilus assembly protein TadD
MSYYRAALAAASTGDLTYAERLVQCSLLLQEDAPNAVQLQALLRQQGHIDGDTLARLRALTAARRFWAALAVKLPKTSRAHTIRGLLYARVGCFRRAREAFALALALDAGNGLAKQALAACAPTTRFKQILGWWKG